MRNASTPITATIARVRPLIRVADQPCVPVTARGPNFQLQAGLIRKARV